MPGDLPASASRVQDAIRARGHAAEVVELPSSTRTAKEAAESLGCQVAQIAKSIVFRASSTEQAVLVIASGTNRVSEDAVATHVDGGIEKADADFVRSETGYVIGGVPPLGHARPLLLFFDEDLLQYDVVWAAAGTPRSVFSSTPEKLLEMTGAKAISVHPPEGGKA